MGADIVILSASVGTVLDNGDGTWSWSLGTVDGPTESQVVTITATDSDQLDTSVTFDLVVTNVAPVIAVDNPIVTVNEGGTAANTGSFGDAGNDALLLSASVGEVTDLGTGQWTWNYTAGDGPADSQVVTITVDDGDGGAASTTFQLNVGDLPPTLSIDQAMVSVQEGQAAANTGTFDDPGDGTVSIDASIGEIIVDEQAGSWSWSYVAGDGPDDSQTVTLTATDNDGAQTIEAFQLDITNVAPSVSATEATVTVNEGEVGTNSGEYSDLPGDSVTLSVSVGTIVDNGDGTWSWSASAADGPADSQTVTVTATDEDGGSQTHNSIWSSRT